MDWISTFPTDLSSTEFVLVLFFVYQSFIFSLPLSTNPWNRVSISERPNDILFSHLSIHPPIQPAIPAIPQRQIINTANNYHEKGIGELHTP